MIKELLKPLEWVYIEFGRRGDTWVTESALHDYQITYDDKEKSYAIFYYERLTEESGNKPGKSVDELKQWAEEVHYPSKMAKWLNPDWSKFVGGSEND